MSIEVDRLDEQKKKDFPEVFRSHKQIRKTISEVRKQLHAEDPKYKELLFATYRAAREIDQHIIAQHPEYDSLPANQQKERLEKWRSAMNRLTRERAKDYFELLENAGSKPRTPKYLSLMRKSNSPETPNGKASKETPISGLALRNGRLRGERSRII